MDPIRVLNRPDPLPRGPSQFIPFEGFNERIENGVGKADFQLAVDLPPMPTIDAARFNLMNNLLLASRIIEYREFSNKEIQASPVLMQYMGFHKS